MLLLLPIIPSRISPYPLFLFYSYAITYYSCYILLIFIVSVTMRSTVYLVADKWVYLVCLKLILPEMLPNFSEKLYCHFHIHHQLANVWLYLLANCILRA